MNKIFYEIVQGLKDEANKDYQAALFSAIHAFYPYFKINDISPGHAYDWAYNGQINMFRIEDGKEYKYRIKEDHLLDLGIITQEQFEDEEFCKEYIPCNATVETIIEAIEPYQVVEIDESYFEL